MTTLSKISFAVLTLTLSVSVLGKASQDQTSLYRMRKIFIRSQDTYEKDPTVPKRLNIVMTEALESFGFTVVANSTDADVIMDGELGGWIYFDQPPPDKPKYSYRYALKSQTGSILWQTDVTVRSRSKVDADRLGLQKVARNLFVAWKQSATKAGITVGDKLP